MAADSKVDDGNEDKGMKPRCLFFLFGLFFVAGTMPPIMLAQGSVLSHYNLADVGVPHVILPPELGEVSGLTVTPDGRLLAHNDEDGIVFQINPTNGKILKRFSLGSGFVRDDFEDIACVGNVIYMVSSSGIIYEFNEGNDGERKKFQTYKTKLNSKNDIEGLAYDSISNSLLLACKGFPGKGLGDAKAIYAFTLDGKSFVEKPRFVVPLKEVAPKTHKGKFGPSGIAKSHAGTFFIIASDGEAIVEINSVGKVLEIRRIPRKTNSHPEGIAFFRNRDMILCNDGQGGKGTIVLYKYLP